MKSSDLRTPPGALQRAKKLFAIACALAFLAPQGHAALFEVTTNAADNSAGSLGAALTAAAGPSDLVFFSPFLPSSLVAPTGPYTSGNVLALDGNQATTVNFTGGMIVTGGVLSVNGLTASGITVNPGGTLSTTYSTINGLTLAGGTYQTLDNSVTSGIAITGGATIDTAGSNPTMSGITGSGGLNVKDSSGGGTGILTLNLLGGANTYTGTTQINSGTLQLGAVNALPAGALNTTAVGATFDLNGFAQTLGAVNNVGTVKIGFAALTAASYSGTGTLSVGLKPGLTNLTVTGNATLTGGTLSVIGHPAPGAYTVVNAGTLTGQFVAINVPNGVTDSFSYSGTSLLLNILSDTPFTISGQSANQASIGAALNVANFTANGDLASVIAQLNALPQAQVNAALDQIGPVSYAALTGMSSAASGVQAAAVAQRLTGLQAGRDSGDGARFASFKVNGGTSYPGVLVADLPGDSGAGYAGDKDRRYDSGSPWGFFVSGLGTFDRLNSISGNSGSQPGYSVTATGETLGTDYRFNEHFAAGVTGGYVNSYAKIAANGGTIYGQSARLGVYGTVYNDEFHGNLFIGGAHDFYAASRNINAFSRTATASPSGSEFNLNATAGWDKKTALAVVSPFIGLAYDRAMLGSFSEGGAGDLDLAVAGQTAESLRSTLGVKVSRQFKVPDWFDFTPYASAGWQHELENQSRALAAQLGSGGTPTFTVMTADVSREAALLGVGADLDWTPGFSTRLAYASTLSSDYSSKTFSGSLRWRF